MTHMVTGIYRDEEHASRAVNDLIERHFEADDISVVVADAEGRRREAPLQHRTRMGTGAAVGAALGATLGGIGAALVSTGVLIAPGLGLAAAGPILAAFEGALAGGGVGSLAGLLAGMGMWKEEAEIQAEELKNGKVLVGVHAERDHIDVARGVFEGAGAERVTVCDTGDATCEQA